MRRVVVFGVAVALAVAMLPMAGSAGAAPRRAAGLDAAVEAALAEEFGATPAQEDPAPGLQPLSDLDGDGLAEVAQYATSSSDPTVDAVTYLDVRSGADGSVLFSKELAGSLVRFWPSDGGLVVTAYKWRYFMGVNSIGPYGQHERPFGAFDDVAIDLRVTTYSFTADGAERWARASGPTTYVYTGTTLAATTAPLTQPQLLADVDGDGDDEVVFGSYTRTPGAAQQDTVTVTAVDRSNAEVLTHTRDISQREAYVLSAGDVTGGAGDELLLVVAGTATLPGEFTVLSTTADPSTTLMGAPGAFSAQVLEGGALAVDGPGSETELVDIASGAVVGSHDGTLQYPIGDADGDGQGDALLTVRFLGLGSTNVTLTAVDRDGESWTVEHGVEGGPTEVDGVAVVNPVGDVDGDGIKDLEVEVGYAGTPAWKALLVSGASGEVIRDGLLGGTPLGASVDGNGDDFYRSIDDGQRHRIVEVVDGLSGAVRWSGSFAGAQSVADFRATVHALPGGGSADVLVSLGSYTEANPYPAESVGRVNARNAWIAEGASGAVRWTTGPADSGVIYADDTAALSRGESTEFERTAVVGAPVGYLNCTDPAAPNDGNCHAVLVEVEQAGRLSASYAGVTPPEPATDIDIYVYRAHSDGDRREELDSSARGILDDDPTDRVEIDVPAGYVVVEYHYFTAPAASFTEVIALD